jgi:hypothetical protein
MFSKIRLLMIPILLWATCASAGYKVTGNLEVTGNAGVGTSNPTAALDVRGTAKATAFVGDGSGLTGIGSPISGLTPGKLPKAGTASTLVDSMIYSNGTNVGIGSTTPRSKLDVPGTVTATAFVGDGSALTGVSSISGLTPGKIPKAGTSSTIVDSVIYSDGTNIGIGTTSPTYALDVSGAIHSSATGSSVFGGNVGIGSASPTKALDVKGDITFDGAIYGDGSHLTGVSTTGGSQWTGTGPIAFSGDVNIDYSTGGIPDGGTVTTDGNYTVQTFSSVGSTTWTPNATGTVEVLVIGGGGAAGSFWGGGGGAGGLIHNASYSVTASTPISVSVGAGGQGSNGGGATEWRGGNGSDSVFGTLTAVGGGGGGYAIAGAAGGSGGGGGTTGQAGLAGGSATSGQGYAGGTAGTMASGYPTGGGGGAGGVGGNTSGSTAGSGGTGASYSITGTSICYAGGGAGSVRTGTGGSATCGGGASGTPAGSSGTNGKGGGGGSGNGTNAADTGGNGGSGVVIIRYLTSSQFVEGAGFGGSLTVANKTTTASLKITSGAADGKIATSDADGNVIWEDAPTGGTSQWSDVDTSIYFTTGNVGIGTSAPLAALDLGDGGLRLGGTTMYEWPSGAWSGAGSDIYYNTGKVIVGAQASDGIFDVIATPASSYTADLASGATITTMDFATDQPGTLAVDDSTSTYWQSNSNASSVPWIKFDFGAGNAKALTKMRLYNVNISSNNTSIKDFILYGSNNNTDWTSVHSAQQANGINQWREFTWTNTTAYRYYRLSVSSVWTATQQVYIPEMELMALQDKGSSLFVATATGNVGISTTVPTQKLEVGGAGSKIRMKSPDGTGYNCGPANGGTWGCS